MAVTAKWYAQTVKALLGAVAYRKVDWVNDTVKVALVKSTYVPSQDKDDFWNDVSANEAAGVGYVAGGKELGEKTLTYDEATNTVRLDAKDLAWAGLSTTARYAVIYKVETEPGDSPLLGLVDFGEDVTVAAGEVKLEWDATDGVLRFVVA